MSLKTKFKRTLAAAVASTVAFGALVATAAPSAAFDGTTGHETTVTYTAGKAQGSNEWGLIGNIDFAASGNNYFPYGIGINPATGDLWVTDSGKMCFGWTCGFLGYVAGQNGQPALRIYPNLNQSSDYNIDGTYTDAANATTTSGAGSGWGDPQIIRDGIFDLPADKHGPRKIAFDADGVAWVIDSEFTQTAAEAAASGPNRIKRFATDGTQLSGAGYSGVWADRSPGSFRNGYSVSVAQLANGDFVANAEVANQLTRFAADGTPKAAILLTNLPVTNPDIQATVGQQVTINPNGVDVDPISGNIYISPVHYYPTGAVTAVNERRGGLLVLNPEGTAVIDYINEGRFGTFNVSSNVMFGPYTNNEPNSANYGNVFAWSQTQNEISEFTSDGTLVRVWKTGSTAAANAQQGVDNFDAQPATVAVPGIQTPRGIDFDKNGYMYVTASEGRAEAGVRILGVTPRPVTSLSVNMGCDTGIELSWAHDALASESIAPTEDYVVEMTQDGGATWTLVPTAKSTELSHSLDAAIVDGLDAEIAAGNVGFRVSAWNAAGNGDWIAASLSSSTCFDVAKTGVLSADGKSVIWQITVTNTGRLAIPALELRDALVSSPDANGTELSAVTVDPAQLTDIAPGENATVTVATPVTDEQRAAEAVHNKVVVSGGGEIKTAFASVPLVYNPDISITKSGELAADTNSVTWNVTVTNTGNVNLANVTVADDAVQLELVAGDPANLPVGGQLVYKATQAVTEADRLAEKVTNTASATADTPGGNIPTVSAETTAEVATKFNAQLAVDKIAEFVTEDEIIWKITASNTGDVTISNVTFTDSLGEVTVTWPGTVGELAVGETATATLATPVTSEIIAAGSVTNTVNVTGGVNGVTVTGEAAATVTQIPASAIAVTKTGVFDSNANVINWTIVATNTGNTTLNSVSFEDALPGISELTPEWPQAAGVLAPGESVTVTATSPAAQETTEQTVVNTVIVNAISSGQKQVSDTAEATVVVPAKVIDPVPDPPTTTPVDPEKPVVPVIPAEPANGGPQNVPNAGKQQLATTGGPEYHLQLGVIAAVIMLAGAGAVLARRDTAK